MAPQMLDHHSHLDEGGTGGSPWIFALPFAISIIALVSLISFWITR